MDKLVSSKVLVYLFFSALFFWIGMHLYHHIDTAHGFILGDWLVNYHDGGFKRRGLSGSLFFIIHDITGVSLKTLVFSFQMLLYLLLFILLAKLIHNKKVSLLFFSLILSPLTFFLYLNDPNIVGRKEILLFVIFAYFILLLGQDKFKGYREYLIYFLLFSATFLHEIFIFYIPHFIIALYIFKKKWDIGKSIKLFLCVLIPTVAIFFMGGLINQGESLELIAQRGVVFQNGKLNIFDFSNTLLSSLDRYRNDPIPYSLYSVSLILGLVHFSFYLNAENKTDFKVIIKYFLLAILYSLPLFVLVCDWGRWLQIHFILLLLILAAKLQRYVPSEKKQFNFNLKWHNIALLTVLIPFFFTWRMYHFKIGFSLDGLLYFGFKNIFGLP